ncbi:hypothetical protein [Amycolatopsis minnesotensis]|uniref:Uncharacterized protein n=1 Tax=Amycolatopsis minnesotensis TaxID=337894 RepID=A0ABP5BTA8_9PSEU
MSSFTCSSDEFAGEHLPGGWRSTGYLTWRSRWCQRSVSTVDDLGDRPGARVADPAGAWSLKGAFGESDAAISTLAARGMALLMP